MKKCYIFLLMCILSSGIITAQNLRQSPQEAGASRSQKLNSPISPEVSAIPKAIIYTMNGDWSQYVPVTLSEDGKTLLSFPAPSDITDRQTPVNVGDGYWLDRRGIGPNTVFTRWTYAEYSVLPKAPSPDEIMSNIIPGARITEILELPLTASAASQSPSMVRRLVSDGLKGAVIRYRLSGIKNAPLSPDSVLRGEPGPRPSLLTRDRVIEPVCR